jgi:Chlorophyll A-B binding protein
MDKQDTKYGFTSFAENWNGRLAMLGFIIAIATELLTGKGILGQLGIM